MSCYCSSASLRRAMRRTITSATTAHHPEAGVSYPPFEVSATIGAVSSLVKHRICGPDGVPTEVFDISHSGCARRALLLLGRAGDRRLADTTAALDEQQQPLPR